MKIGYFSHVNHFYILTPYGHSIYIKTYIPEFFVGFEFAYRMWLNDPENMHTNFSFSFI